MHVTYYHPYDGYVLRDENERMLFSQTGYPFVFTERAYAEEWLTSHGHV